MIKLLLSSESVITDSRRAGTKRVSQTLCLCLCIICHQVSKVLSCSLADWHHFLPPNSVLPLHAVTHQSLALELVALF